MGPPSVSMAAAVAAPPVSQQLTKIEAAASEFESLLIEQMLRSAHESDGSTLDNDDSEANSSLLDLSEQQFARALANSGGLGIAKMVVAGLSKDANR